VSLAMIVINFSSLSIVIVSLGCTGWFACLKKPVFIVQALC